jgi:uncharacterized protein (DUF58 family)
MTTQELLRQVRKVEITTRGLVSEIFSGDYHSVFKGHGIAFSEVREYQYGDDVKNIDWNVTARFNHPFIKVFEEERELTLMLLVDMSRSQEFGSRGKTKKDIAMELSAILAFSALKNNDRVGCILFTDRIEKFIPPRKNRNHVLRIIREIISFEPKSKKTNIKSALEYCNSVIKRKAIVFLISDFIDKDYSNVLKIVGKKHDLIGIVLSDPLEGKFPSVGLVEFVDPETGAVKTIDTTASDFKSLFKKDLPAKRDEQKKMFSTAKLDAVWLSVPSKKESFAYLKPLTLFFKKRARRW